MSKKIFFLGPLYPPDQEARVHKNARVRGSSAPNVFQWNLLNGMQAIAGEDLFVFNVLPVGSWPRGHRDAFLKDTDWTYQGVRGHEIGSINVPFLKQSSRARRTKKILKKTVSAGDEIVIYSAYMPFLKAIYKLPKGIKVTVIVTDLPEFYDLGKVSKLRSFLRNMQNRMIYKYMQRVDRFVVLTEQMCEPLKVGNRPWIRMEGICNAVQTDSARPEASTKAILYSGTLHYQYGIKNLLDAFSKITVEGAELWICGGGEAEKEIRELEKKDSRVKFFGFCSQEKVAELRSKAAVLVNPRTNEGEYTKYSFPSKTMEYMASGKPVVMYKLDGVPAEYDEHLFYADATNAVDGLQAAIEAVLDNYESAKTKAEKAQKFVLENKNGVAQASRLIDFLDV
ncbi:MAG: glycosyltransferase family 4 protein [Clostridia bacterium]|nr:glycosyltransferase family 4 protein [Clostridia bacterium]